MKDEPLSRRGLDSFPPEIQAKMYCDKIDEIHAREALSPVDQQFKQLDLKIRFELGLTFFYQQKGATFTEKLFAEYKPPQDTPDNVHQLFPSPIDEMLQTIEPEFQELAHRLLHLSPSFYKFSFFHS